MTQLLLTPFSLSVLNVAVLLTVLIGFLLRIPDKQPATRNLLTFLLGADLVFLAFFYIFSSLDPQGVRLAWWVLHAVVFAIVFLVQFAYHYPRTVFVTEARHVFRLSLLLSLAVYLFYLYHTTLLHPHFDPNGGLFTYPGTHEIGILVVLELLWTLLVLGRQAKNLKAQIAHESPDAQLLTRSQISALHKLSLILLSPVVLVAFIVLAYLGQASWGIVGHLLGSGLMVFVLLFTVVYLNNALEPSTLQVKMLGISLGLILVLLGFASAITLDIYQRGYLSLKQAEIEQSREELRRGDTEALPADIAYVIGNGRLLLQRMAGDPLQPASTREWQSGWRFQQLDAAERFYISYRTTITGEEYEVGYRYRDYRVYLDNMARPLLYIILLATLLVVIVFPLFFRLSLFAPLQRLLRGVGSIERGNLDINIPISVHDEIGGLTHAFNTMTGSIRQAREKLHIAYNHQLDLTEAYSRFVPQEILSTLNKQSIIELGLGDNVRREMTILFSDIRSFTTISENMTPEQVFSFINSYLRDVGPIIRRHGGYIDKYIGDAVMALFPNGPDAALDAAIEMQQQAHHFNHRRDTQAMSSAEIRIGVGIHTGELMLGTIGEPQRMEGTVISDAVNLASRIEGLTKIYNAPILFSYATFQRLAQPQRFNIRELDRVRVKGKQQWVEIIELLDGMEETPRERKLALKEEFARAVAAFQAERFAEAQTLFQALKQQDPTDVALDVYLERCAQFIELGIPEGWDGAVKL
ncbi:MAG: HAMP domain-containing protein [Gammaproteobacteria bacterium]|nr:HAMP domain-containing protein [Gammaproteobacteria bacterium]MCW8974014.1 HAMP domain-containing protein [Gammaproteobacteria bacterium]MCW8994084.1 HAMP domain-containing protein [Gammaproteobacteria bacterium]